MPLNVLFWMIYIITILFSWWVSYEANQPAWYRRALGYTALWVLVGLLGYRVFGPAVR
jgi:hypothetical protein